MKRITIFLAISAALIGCQETLTNTEVQENAESFEAMVEGFEDKTKTTMTDERNIVWSEGDRIAILQGSNVEDKYILKDEAAGTGKGEFTLESDESEVNGDFTSGMEIRANIALYPYSDDLTCTDISIRLNDSEELKAYKIENITLPSVQEYVPESFGEGTFPMVAVTETMADHKLNFKNVMGAIKLQLKGTQIVKSIKIEGNNNEILSGAASITAYVDDLPPVIKPTDATATSVTLDCGDGVQLDESTATDFIIALPPVLFSQGFTVTVTDDASQTYTIETTVANTVLRSSILVMPAVTLTAAGGGAPDDSEDDATYIEYVFLSKSSLTMMPNTSYTLVADIDPVDVTYPTLTWSSSDNSVAEVDQDGNVTAKSDGNVTITALAVGGVGKSCSVTVKTPKTFASGDYVDYVDESGVNHGKGVAVAGVIWAPVNCGYEPATADYKGYLYGKLYQWGRKHGQGYNINDASYPSGENLVEGPVMPSWGSSDTYKDAFFYTSSDWCNTQIDDLWVDSEGKKTKKDPCPTGWRVPTYAELSALCKNYSWLTKDNHAGCYFVGEYTYIEGLPQVFFPAAGYRGFDGTAYSRGNNGYYWSSTRSYDYAADSGARRIIFSNGGAFIYGSGNRANGYSVRCVQE